MTITPPTPGPPQHPRRRTRWTVRAVDRLARAVISIGGLLVIGAVLLVCVYLTIVVLPLFRGNELRESASHVVMRGERDPRAMKSDEYRSLAWLLGDDWEIRVFRPDTGERVSALTPFEGTPPRCVSVDAERDDVVFGFDDGTIRQGRLTFASEVLSPEQVPIGARSLREGERLTDGGRVLESIEGGRVRSQRLEFELEEPTKLSDSAIVLLDETRLPNGYVIAALAADGNLMVRSATTRTNLMTGEETVRLSGGDVRIPTPPGQGAPVTLMVTGNGDCVFLIWKDGTAVRVDSRVLATPNIVETIDLVDDPEAEVTAAAFLLGRSSLLIGDSKGAVGLWFRTKPANAETSDGVVIRLARRFEGDGSPVTGIGPAPRKRLVAMASQKGTLKVYYATNGKLLAEAESAGAALGSLSIAPKGDAVLGMASGTLYAWGLEAEHPESSFGALFSKIWYEGYAEPEYSWQSSSGTDDFEPKLSLVPLIFGTLKATVYCLIFGLPMAILAAIYTSEFMSRKARATVKPMIEMMASLPSVVLGFLAAVIFAPFISEIVPATLAAIVMIPMSLVLGACLWQLLPRGLAIRHASSKPWAMGVLAAGGVAGATVVGPFVERALFAGDLKSWLSGATGTAAPGWMVLLTPLCVGAGLVGKSRLLETVARAPSIGASRRLVALVDFALYVGIVVAGLGLAYGLGLAVGATGLDIRGAVVGTYAQRNALVVGFVMGFAVIPIIYTVAEDALNAVPEHLRAASLGAGATQWQTAWRVIVPTAMSGLFSAVMIGFGRAVGETMIVLMAAGNTAIMDWNIFEGFRTLSANIATELPESVQGSTHYRMLFLAALVLFIMTFIVNTIAEVVRQRFRKRAFQL